MSLTLFIDQGASSGAVQLPPITFSRIQTFIAPCYSGVKFSSDGNIYARQGDGAWSAVAVWLLNGVASDYYITRAIISGTLTTDDGAGPLILSSSREYDVQRFAGSPPAKTASNTFEIENISTTVLASATYSFSAFYDNGL